MFSQDVFVMNNEMDEVMNKRRYQFQKYQIKSKTCTPFVDLYRNHHFIEPTHL